MRLILVSLLCAGCSLVNSTDDLRNLDASVPDASADGVLVDIFDSGPMTDVPSDVLLSDAPPSDGGEVEPLDAEPSCVGDMSISVLRPSHPPVLTLAFSSAACAVTLVISGPGVNETRNVAIGQESLNFVYGGPRIPLIDGTNRERIFTVNGTEVPVQMPIEQLQAEDMGGNFHEDITYPFNPSLDIANNGTVVFDSNDVMLGAEGDMPALRGNIYAWPTNGTAAIPAMVERPGQGAQQLAAASISDDGQIIAWANRATGTVHLHMRGLNRTIMVPLGSRELTDNLNLDIRHDTGTSYALLARVRLESGGTQHYALVSFDSADESFSVSNQAPGSRGLLFRDVSSGFGYAAMDSGEAFGHQADGTRITPATCPSVDFNQTRIHVRSAGAGARFARMGTCSGATNQFIVGLDSFAVDTATTFLGAADDQSMLLLRSDQSSGTENAYFVAESLEGRLELHGLNRNGAGDVSATRVEFHLSGAAISPNGEWAAYALVPTVGSIKRMRIYRIPTRNPMP